MKINIISDTHFGHEKIIEYCKRPHNCDEIMLENLRLLPKDSLLIHLGDICIGNDAKWHEAMDEAIPKEVCRILVRGNHDSKSDYWYMNNGWHFVCKEFKNKYFGKNIVFTHIPIPNLHGYLNVHGHLHNIGHRDEECSFAINSVSHILYSPELFNYKPINLELLLNTSEDVVE